MRNVEQAIREINGTMTIENMPLTDGDKKRLRDVLSGRVSIDIVIKQLTDKHRNPIHPTAKL
ncbi:MAG: hypothetical protein FWG87_06105 [Defluviitaleaceae bacterium]|nr:hypothetical protein [Defluviitaleaceae bacterium]